jgi:hypothetical protein
LFSLIFILQVTKDCDCLARNQTEFVRDVGIAGSFDPVAIDRARLIWLTGQLAWTPSGGVMTLIGQCSLFMERK